MKVICIDKSIRWPRPYMKTKKGAVFNQEVCSKVIMNAIRHNPDDTFHACFCDMYPGLKKKKIAQLKLLTDEKIVPYR